MKRFLYALVALIATLSFSVGVRSAAWASGAETWKIVPSAAFLIGASIKVKLKAN